MGLKSPTQTSSLKGGCYAYPKKTGGGDLREDLPPLCCVLQNVLLERRGVFYLQDSGVYAL